MTTTWLPVHRTASVGPQDALTFEPARSFADQTLRQVIHLHRGGPALRIHVSNRFGEGTLHIDEVRAAIHVGAGRIGPATDIPVTFGGTKHLEIAPGRSLVSDPVELAVADDSELAISSYLGRPSGPATHHQSALQASYITGGNTAGAEALAGAEESSSLYWITGIDVAAAADGPVIAAFGDSLTNGDGSTPGTNNRYTDHLSRRLARPVLNLGISGNRLLRHGFGQSGLARFEHDVLGIPGVSHVVIELGINDIGQAGTYNLPLPQADDVIHALRTLARCATAAGIVPIAATIPPYRDTIYPKFFSEEGEQIRHKANAWMRSAQEFHAVLDMDAQLDNPQRPGHLDPALDKGDHLHPNDAGHRAIADAFDPAWLEA